MKFLLVLASIVVMFLSILLALVVALVGLVGAILSLVGVAGEYIMNRASETVDFLKANSHKILERIERVGEK